MSKKIIIIYIFIFSIGFISSVVASYSYTAKEIKFSPNNIEWDVDNVGSAVSYLKSNIKDKYDLVYETGTYSVQANNYYTLKFQNTYTEDDNAYFSIDKIETTGGDWYISWFNNYKIVGNECVYYYWNKAGTGGTITVTYSVIKVIE